MRKDDDVSLEDKAVLREEGKMKLLNGDVSLVMVDPLLNEKDMENALSFE